MEKTLLKEVCQWMETTQLQRPYEHHAETLGRHVIGCGVCKENAQLGIAFQHKADCLYVRLKEVTGL